MPFCTECGGQVADSANFCTHCGKAVKGRTAAAPAVTLSANKVARISQEWDALLPSDWGSKKHADERALLSGLLEDDEPLKCLVSGSLSGPEASGKTYLGVATDRRIIFLRKERRADKVVKLPYPDIIVIAPSSSFLGGNLKVSVQGKGRFEMSNIEPQRRSELFVKTVQPYITAVQAGNLAKLSKEDRIDQEWYALSPTDWGVKKHANERAMLNALLADNEGLKCLVGGVLSGTEVSIKAYVGVATDRRIVFLRKEKRSEVVVELPYPDIGVITYSPGFMSGTLKVSAQGKGRFEMSNIDSKRQAELFVETVRPYIAVAQAGNPVKLSKEDRIDQEWYALIPEGWGSKKLAKEREMLYNVLEDDETMECLVGGHFGPDLGQSPIEMGKSIDSGVGVATDRRVILLYSGFLSAEVAELPYRSVETISYGSGGLKIAARGATSFQMEMINPTSQAKVFADTVRKHLNAGPTVAAPTVVQTASAMDELEKAAALYERGLLTPEEFAAKKAQLLNS